MEIAAITTDYQNPEMAIIAFHSHKDSCYTLCIDSDQPLIYFPNTLQLTYSVVTLPI